MELTLLITDVRHPIVPHLREWQAWAQAQGHGVELVHDRAGLRGGDILFLVSCAQIIGAADRARYRATLVLHASALPDGRGWSPHVWAILAGESRITVTLLEASDGIDTGPVWLQCHFRLEGHELLPEINALLFNAELSLMTQAVERFSSIRPQPQLPATHPPLRRRTPEDSRLDPMKSLAEQFDLLRVADAERYPAFFEFRGHRYVLKIVKEDTDARS